MAEVKKSSSKSKLWDFLVICAVVYLASDLIFRFVWPKPVTVEPGQSAVVMTMESEKVREGNNPVLVFRNNGSGAFVLSSQCPKPPVEILKTAGASGASVVVAATDASGKCPPALTIASGDKGTLNLGPWKEGMFQELGTYQVRTKDAEGATITTQFTMTPLGIFTKLFRAVLTKPFLNFLILVASILPGHSLGWGIILLTLLVKILLFIPTQHALEGQKKMQLLQPKLEAVRKQYKDDSKKLNEETLKLWKENKVNPMQSCLPILVQFPVLIGLFYVIRDSSSLALSHHLIYPTYQHITWDFNPHFLGLDLTSPNVWLFPPLLVILQFIQMKLTFAIAKKKQDASGQAAKTDSATDIQQKVMLYVLPLMIGFFAFRFPSAVSLYWGISTLFAIGQQVLVNREHLRVKTA